MSSGSEPFKNTAPQSPISTPRNAVFAWEFWLLKVLLVGLVAIALEHPAGSLKGNIALEQKDFNLYSYNLRENHVYAIVNGPRKGPQVERGAWVSNDGSFQIDNLPVGEYTLKVRAPGFGTEFLSGLFVEDGKVSGLKKPVKLSLLDPTVNIASNSRVYTTHDAPAFWVNATGASDAEIKVYKKDMLALVAQNSFKQWGAVLTTDFGVYMDSSVKFKNPFENEAPLKTFKRKLEQDDTDSAHAEFKFDSPLPAGDYITVAQVTDIFGKKTTSAVSWFSVSDIGLVIKKTPDSTFARAIDLRTLKGVPGVQVEVARRAENVLSDKKSAVTGADGTVLISLPESLKGTESSDMMVTGKLGNNHAYGGFNYYRSETDQYKTYFYTDRPVYRLGQTVLFKAISRLVKDDGLVNPGKGRPVMVTVEDPDNNTLKTINLKTNEHGSVNGLIEIPENGKTGGYQVQIVYQGGHTDYESFEVAQYRKPEYEVKVEPLSPRVIAGDTAKAKITASYYFGGPVANARVHYRVYSSNDYSTRWKLNQRPDYYDFFDSWQSGDDEYSDNSGDFTEEGNAVTDANGQAIVEFKTKAPEMPQSGPFGSEFTDKTLTVEAEVTDISRLSVISKGNIKESSGAFLLTVDPASWVVKVGDAMVLNMKAVDYDGKPIANQSVELKMIRFPYDRIKQEYKPLETLTTDHVTTDSTGKASLSVHFNEQMATDSYYFLATAKDAQGHLVADSTSVWVAAGNRPFFYDEREAKQQPLTVKLDKKVYKQGETAKVIITGPFTGKEGMEALVAIEGTKLHEVKIVPLTSSAQLVEIPIKANYVPNFYITTTIVGKSRQFYNQEEMVMVSPENHFLKLSISTDKEKYKPGDQATYTIKAVDKDNKPVAGTELSLGVVDESIYSIRPETAQDIRHFFYSQLSNWVTTLCSFPEEYSGGPDKLEPRVRKDFKDTAVWFPNLVTDKNGIATAQFKMPDNLTTWRATVRAVTMQSDVGSSISKVMVSQDIIARLALPRFFCQGDQGLVTAIVHNYTDKKQEVKLKVDLGRGLKTTIPLAQSLTIAPEGAQRFNWPVIAENIGETTIKLTAVGNTAADALERKLSINPYGVEVRTSQTGVITGESDSRDLELSAIGDASKGTIKRDITLASSTIGPVIGNFSALIDYPYGCTEQTMSRLMPSVIAMRLHTKLGAPLAAADIKRFDQVYKMAMEKLHGYQHGDGGWGWWENDTSRPYLTSYVMEGMYLLKDAGYAVDDASIKKALGWLNRSENELVRQLTDPKRVADSYIERESTTDLAYMLFANSLWQKKAPKEVEAALTYLDKDRILFPEALAYLARAENNFGKPDRAKHTLERLLALANQTDSSADWEFSKTMAKKLGTDLEYNYRFSAEETTALALNAIVEVSAQDDKLIERSKNWLLMSRGKDGWGSTKATSAVFKVLLAEELLARNAGGTNGGTNGTNTSPLPAATAISCLASIGDGTLADLTFNPNQYGPENIIKLPSGPGASKLTLKKAGQGRLFYNMTSSYYRNLALAAGAAAAPLENQPSGLKVVRQFMRMTTLPASADGVIHLKAVPITGEIKAGETILMKVRIESPCSLPYVIVQAALPSGAEVVDSQGQKDAEEQATIAGDWSEPWWIHQDVLDDRIVFFGSDIKPGVSEFHTLLRMELPGKINVNPANIAGMYNRGINGYSQSDVLNITE